MHADSRRVETICTAASWAPSVHLGPDTSTPPANEAIVAGGVGAEADGQIAPWRPRLQDPEEAVEDTTIVHPWHAARLVRQHRLVGSPLIVGEFVGMIRGSKFGSLNQGPALSLNMPLSQVLLVAMPP